MAVDPKDRKEYERGVKDRKKEGPAQWVRDATGIERINKEYAKGRRGEQFDGDKKK